ncbi:hypothetical protein C8J57DRAFT_1534408 [Mycena rebaudengoi]|nr:hypothetical protein C8J57DRAFT_1534408 [Mycena rebaudengoi]
MSICLRPSTHSDEDQDFIENLSGRVLMGFLSFVRRTPPSDIAGLNFDSDIPMSAELAAFLAIDFSPSPDLTSLPSCAPSYANTIGQGANEYFSGLNTVSDTGPGF